MTTLLDKLTRLEGIYNKGQRREKYLDIEEVIPELEVRIKNRLHLCTLDPTLKETNDLVLKYAKTDPVIMSTLVELDQVKRENWWYSASFAERFVKLYAKFPTHHRVMLDDEWDIAHKKNGLLMLMVSPRAGKSTYLSLICAMFMGLHPRSRVMNLSYGYILSTKYGQRLKLIVRSKAYILCYRTQIDNNKRATTDFLLTNGSSFYTNGIKSGYNGMGSDLTIVDDPVKNKQDAMSSTVQDVLWGEWVASISNRTENGCASILTMTRWSPVDICGRLLGDEWKGESGLLKLEDGNIWKVTCMQARCLHPENDPLGRQFDEYIWPEYWGEEYWAIKEHESKKWSFNALHMQTPIVEGGELLKPDMIKPWLEHLPPNRTTWTGWDWGYTENEDSDESWNWTMCKFRDRRSPRGYYKVILRIDHAKVMSKRKEDWIKKYVDDKIEGSDIVPIDPVSGRMSMEQILPIFGSRNVRCVDMGNRKTYTVSETDGTDKAARAESFAAEIESGVIFVLPHIHESETWQKVVKRQFTIFPRGGHHKDDSIDAATIANFALEYPNRLLNAFKYVRESVGRRQ